MKNIQAVLLAGGVGKRMWPLSQDKSLLKFLGKSIVETIVNDLVFSGVKDIKIVGNKNNIQVIKKIALTKKAKINFKIQSQPKGMANALKTIKPLLASKPIMIIIATDWYEKGVYKNFLKQIGQDKIVLAGLKVKKYLSGGYFKLKKEKIIGLVEKPGEKNMPSNYFKLVMDYFYSPQLFFHYLAKASSSKDDLYEVALDKIINSQEVKIIKIKSAFQQIKYPWHVLEMTAKFLHFCLSNKISKSAKISSQAVIIKPVFIASGVKIMAGACLKGPCYVGKNTVIGNNALVRESIIGSNCTVGYNTEIARSWIGDQNWFHCNYIGDSVIEGSSNFGSGARLANFRFDGQAIQVKKNKKVFLTNKRKLGAIIGKNVKIGVNAAIMPGIMVGKNSFIGAGTVLNKNLKNKSRYF